MRAATVSYFGDDSVQNGRDVAAELLDQLGRAPDLVIVFSSARHDHARVLDGLHELLPDVRVVGCSSYGEINSEEGVSNSVTAMGIVADAGRFATFALRDVAGDSRAGGRAFAEEVRAFAPDLLVVFPDGMRVNSTQFLLGLQDVLGATFPIIGGVAADAGDFTRTFELFDREVITGGAVGVAFKGVRLVTAACSGWLPIGATRTATRVEDGNVLLELDGQPALDIYRNYLGYRAAEMPYVSVEFPIGVVGGVPSTQRMPEGEILLLRAIKGVDERRRAIVFGGDLPQGAEVRMTRATKDDVIAGADAAGAQVHAAVPRPALAFVFDCMARKVLLGPRYKDELRATFARLGPAVPKVGFYTYGELSPVQGATMHHDETFTIALIEG
jgi:hypothetical protein